MVFIDFPAGAAAQCWAHFSADAEEVRRDDHDAAAPRRSADDDDEPSVADEAAAFPADEEEEAALIEENAFDEEEEADLEPISLESAAAAVAELREDMLRLTTWLLRRPSRRLWSPQG